MCTTTAKTDGLVLFELALVFLCSAVSAYGQYQSADEAWRDAVKHLNARNYAASQEPLEAALRLAPDDAYRLKVYEALLPAYRLLPEPDKFVEACNVILTKSERDAQRSLTRRSLLAFMHQRGKTDQLAHDYEDALKKNPNDRTALYVLSELYGQLKPNPQRAAELIQRLARLDQQQGKAPNVAQSAELARQYLQAKRFVDGAALYEQIAPLDAKLAAWHWKEAAAAWLKAKEPAKALAAAKKAEASPPEARSEQLVHFFHRNLADVFLAVGEPKAAIPHYEKAIQTTTIPGYLEGCKKSLEEARAQVGG